MTSLEIVRENLIRLSEDRELLTDVALYELSELARVTYAEAKKVADHGERERHYFDALLSGTAPASAPREGMPKEYLPFMASERRHAFSLEAAAFSVFLSEQMQGASERVLPWKEYTSSMPRIAYVPVGTADKAFLALSALKENVTVAYAERADDAVHTVLSGKADYVLLPYAAAGERLSGIAKLIAQHELLLSALVTVGDGDEQLSYALFSTDCVPFVTEGELLLDLRVTADDYSVLGEMLAAFPVFGFAQTAFLCEKEEYGRACGRVTLRGAGNLDALWIYFSLMSVGVSFLGRYPHIEA